MQNILLDTAFNREVSLDDRRQEFYRKNRMISDRMARSGIANIIISFGFVFMVLIDLFSKYGIGVYYGMPALIPCIALFLSSYMFVINASDEKDFFEIVETFSLTFKVSREIAKSEESTLSRKMSYFDSLNLTNAYAKDYINSYAIWKIGQQIAPISFAGFACSYLMGYISQGWQTVTVIVFCLTLTRFILVERQMLLQRRLYYKNLTPLLEIVKETRRASKWIRKEIAKTNQNHSNLVPDVRVEGFQSNI